jgi:predicted alpha/beta hydrolase family esterase
MADTRLFLIHGWTGRADQDWFPWAVAELTKRGYEVYAPQLPDTDNPLIEEWMNKLSEVIGEVRPSDIFIAHSLGSNALLRYLQIQPEGARIDKVILVAGAQVLSEAALPLPEDEVIFQPWRDTPIDFAKVRKMARSFIAVFSSNDPWVLFDENSRIYQEGLGAQIIIEENKGHFMAAEGEVIQLPLLVDLVEGNVGKNPEKER